MDKCQYWDRKILKWENSRYGDLASFRLSSWSVQERAKQLHQLLLPKLDQNQLSLVDIGCGSGLLLNRLPLRPDAKITGIDFSQAAIEKARLRNYNCSSTFICSDIGNAKEHYSQPYKIAIMIGFVDWIDSQELVEILKNLNCEELIMSYTEAGRWSLKSSIYQLYRKIEKPEKSIEPRSFRSDEITSIISQSKFEIIKDASTRAMYPGKLLCLRQKRTSTK